MKKKHIALIMLLGLLGAGLHCARNAPHRTSRMVKVDATTTLEVLDWGGRGFPVVFLAGLGHTAHVFDEFAPALTDRHRVLGITRRGFGASSQPDSGYDLPTLAEDIRIVLDSLGIERAVLVAHSLGGDEMTWFARRHPARVAALVYIEAAYLRASERDSLARYPVPESETPLPGAEDSASAAAFRAYYARANGVLMPRSEIEAMYRWSPEGRLLGHGTPFWIYRRIRQGLGDPDYSTIRAPALAIYATDYPITELFMDFDRRDSVTQAAMRTYHEASLRIGRLSRDHFRAQMSGGKVLEIPGAGHSLYITHAPQALAAIKAFLEEAL